jgi:chemotaxis family two-component system response regulator Rcp1
VVVTEVAGSKLILLVEDNYGDTKLVEMGLRNNGSDTRLKIITDGEQALSYLFREGAHANARRPDLVILDWDLPRKNGFEVLRLMKLDPVVGNIPVVVFTGGKFTLEIAADCNGQVVFCVVKPARLESFFAVIKAIDEYVKAAAKFPQTDDENLEMLRRLIAA